MEDRDKSGPSSLSLLGAWVCLTYSPTLNHKLDSNTKNPHPIPPPPLTHTNLIAQFSRVNLVNDNILS